MLRTKFSADTEADMLDAGADIGHDGNPLT